MVRISKAKSQDQQMVLWDWVGNVPFTSMAQARPYTGDFFEEATKHLFMATRLTTAGDVCPDLQRGNHNYECKSVGRQRQCIMYQHNVVKYRQLIRETGCEMSFVFWFHQVEVLNEDGSLAIQDLFSLRRELAAKLERVLVVKFSRLDELLQGVQLKVINFRGNRNDWTTRTDMPGYRIPWRNFSRLLSGVALETPPMSVYGVPVASKPLFFA